MRFKLQLRLISFSHRDHTNGSIEFLYNYLGSIETEIKALKAKYWELIEEYPERDFELSEDYSEFVNNYETLHPQILYSSMILYSYSIFEVTLSKIAQMLGNTPIPNSGQNRPKKIAKYKQRIEHYTGLSFDENEELWNLINGNYADLRNCIAHDNIIKVANSTLYEFVKTHQSFSIQKGRAFKIINEQIVIEVMTSLNTYINYVIQKLEKINNINI